MNPARPQQSGHDHVLAMARPSPSPANQKGTAPAEAPLPPVGRSSAQRLRRVALDLAPVSTSVLLALAAPAAMALLLTTWSAPAGLGDLPASAAGPGVVTVLPRSASAADGRGVPGGPGALTLADVSAVAGAIPNAPLMSRVVLGADEVVTDAAPHARVEGVDPSYPQVLGAAVARGAFFTAEEAAAASPVAVLGQTVALSLFPDGEPAIGRTLRVRGQPFTVVGVLAGQLGPATAAADDTVLVPFQTGQVRLFGTRSAYELVVQVPDGGRASAVDARVEQLLRQRHRLTTGQPDDFAIRTDSIAASGAGQTTGRTAVRATQLVEQYTCRSKAVCLPGPLVR